MANQQGDFLSVDQMLAVQDVKYAEVEAWGGKVRLASISAEELINFVEGNQDPEKKRVAGVRILVQSLVDKDGNRIGRPEHVEMFLKKDAAEVSKVVDAIMELNRMNEKKVEELKKS